MNRIYRVLWSNVHNAWVVASELATGRGKGAGTTTVARPTSASAHCARSHAWPLRMAILAALLAVQSPGVAADLYWDANDTDLGLGGAGTWNLNPATLVWSLNNDGVSGPFRAWNNATLDNAIFAGTGGLVTLGEPITAHNLTFNSNGYSLGGSTLTLAGTTPTITTATNVTTAIDSVIAGTAGFTKAGSGALILNGINTFTGGINLTGSIYAASDAALGAASNNITTAAGVGARVSIGGTVDTARTVTIGTGGTLFLEGTRAGSALITGDGNVNVHINGVTMSNDANTYTGTTQFNGCNGVCNTFFTSIADLGLPSSLGAPSTVANGTIVFAQSSQYSDNLMYIGGGHSSNRNWSLSGGAALIRNRGFGTLTLTGNIVSGSGSGFYAEDADIQLLGVLSGAAFTFTGNAGRTVTLAGANTYTGTTSLGATTVVVPVLANVGVNSSFGTGAGASGGLVSFATGVLSYTGGVATTNRPFDINNSTIANDGSGALTLTGTVNQLSHLRLGGSYTGADNTVAGVISGTGDVVSNGAATWVLSAANTRTGGINVQSGTLRAGSAQAFGTTTAITTSGGTLDLNDFNLTAQSLAGTGGTLDLGTATLTIDTATGTTNYGGAITGSGGLTKLGLSTQTLSGANTYTGATTIGGGTLGLNFAAAGGPTSDILSSLSTLNLAGGNLVMTGAATEDNTQTFAGVNVLAGTNNISVTSGTGHSATLNLGAINRAGGLVDFDLPTSGFITTSNGSLGGWATVNNGANYATVVGGNIVAVQASDYTIQNNPSLWQDNQIITDSSTGFTTTAVDSPDGTLQLGGLRYTAARATTVNIASGDTLGIDGNILVTPTVGGFNQTITGGSLTGPLGGGMLGVQQNSTGTFTIASQITDNGSDGVGFTKAGSGTVAFTNASNTYSGPTIVSQGTLQVGHIANGGQASSIGDSSAAPSNLVIESATLSYTGTGDTSDRGFTISRGGAAASEINVSNAAANLTFGGQVTSPNDAELRKTGAGTLTLANGANDYAGITTVAGGTLSVTTLANGGSVSSIGRSSSSSANLVLSGGGALQYTANDATVSSNRGFTLGTGGGGINVSDAETTLTLSGTAVGTGAFRKDGAGTLVLSGTNAYTGATTINGGTLRAGSTNAFGGPALMTLANTAGATLDLAGFNTTIGALSGGGANGGNVLLGAATLTMQNTNGTYSGAISGAGGLLKQGSGTQTMVGCNHAYTGATAINGGTLSVNCLADGGLASGIGSSSNTPGNLSIAGGTLNYTGGSISIDRGFQTGFGYVSVIAGTTLQFEGQVTGDTLVKSGDGTLVLSGTNNNYTGITYVNAGTLRAGATNAFGTSAIRMDIAGATLDLDGFDTTVGYLNETSSTANRNITLDGATLTINGNGGSYSGVISGAGSLVKSAGSAQVLTGCNNSYTGSTRITGGGLTVSCLNDGGINSSIGNASADATSLYINGTLGYVGAGSTTNRQFTMGTAGATLDASGTGAVSFTNTAPITIEGTTARTLTLRGTNTDNNTLAAQLSNSSSGATRLTKLDAGTWVLTNPDNSYTGITTISGGVLAVSKLADGLVASSIGASSSAATNLVIGNESRLRYTGAGDTTNRRFTLSQGVTYIESSGSGAVQFTDTGNVTLSGAGARTIAVGGTNTGLNTMGGTIADANVATGKTTLAKNDSGTWVLTGNNTYTGNTVINDGNLIIGNGGTTGNAGAGNVIVDSATSTLSINRSDAFNFNGTLSGPGALAQIGTGTTRLTSASNSIGATTVSAGTLEVEVGGALTTATIAMNGTSTLDVEGTVQASGGTAAVFAGDAGASTVNVDTGATLRASGDLGDGSDVVNVTGTLDTGAAALGLGAGNDTFTLNDGGIISGTGVDAGAATTADTLQINNAANRVFTSAGMSGFERLVKHNTGVLTMTGTQTYSAGTEVDAGTLDVDGTFTTATIALADGTLLDIDGTVQGSGGSPAAITGSAGTNTILVNAGAALSANGDLDDGGDLVVVAGALSTGTGTLNLGAADDTLMLQDGAVISGAGVDGGDASTEDYLVLQNAGTLTLDVGMTAGFEMLEKNLLGVARLTGNQTFGAGARINGGELDVDGTLDTGTVTLASGATLNVDGTVQGVGGTQATITGSTGINTVRVNGTLVATGDLDDGADVVTLSGTLNTGAGTFGLGAADDTLTLNDGAAIGGTGVDAGAGANDRLILNNASALAFNGSATSGFEALTKQSGGIATMTGTQTFSAGTTISGGTLSVAGTLQTPTLSLADGTTLDIDGTVQAAGATQSAITGSAGANTVTVAAGGTLLATGDLANGADVLDVAGTLDTGGGTLSLGDGDDSFVVHDGTNVVGTVDGGAGLDTRAYDIDLNADVGALLGFEGLTKSGTGTLNINGPGGTTLADVEVLAGTLNVAVAGAVTGVASTTVASGATLNVDGAYDGSAGNDTFTLAGTVSGGGNIDLGGGDDTLTLQDGAALNAALSGGAVGTDSVVLDNANALTFDGTNVAGFEDLTKQNTGTATLAGLHDYDSAAIDGGGLDVDGTLNTGSMTLADGTTLNVDGTVQAAGGTQSAITGSTGVNTIVVNGGGTLLASGDLGDGNDVLDVAGTLDTGGGTFSLGAGDDTFVVHNTTQVIGTLDAGVGNDLLNVNVDAGNRVPLGSTTGFESLGKSGAGALEINGASDFVDVQVQAGLLDITATGSIETQTATVASGATLNVDGALTFTTGADDFTIGGAVTGTGSVDMLDGDDQLTILDGANLSGLATSLDGGTGNDTLTANIATSATLGGVTGFETLTKDGAGALDVAGPASSSFATVLVQDGLLDVAATANLAGVTATTIASGATLNVDGAYAGSAGNDAFTVAGTVSGAGSINLGGGDDVLTIQEGAALTTVIDGGADIAGDRVVLDNTSALTFGGTDVSGFEHLTKQNTGTATLAGTHIYDSATIGGGTLDVDGTLESATAALADGTTLNVDGTMQGAGGAQAAIAGSTGVNTITVSAGGTLLATGDLGDGSDVLDVGGTLDAGAGNFNLGAGDDTFVIHDGTNVAGTVVGGAGLDTRVYDIAAVANVGALQEFEGLTKQNTGTLNINGPGTTDLLEVAVEGGTLNIAAGGDVTGVQTTTVDAGATLNVAGSYAGSTGNDTFTVAGTVSGAGSIELGAGDDTLTLQDGATLNAPIDGGGLGSDRVVLDNASALTFGGTNVAGFETLVKQNTGTATLVGTHIYVDTAIDGGSLDVDGTLETASVGLADGATLNVDGAVQATGATQTAITGTTGVNSIVVNAGGTLLATGDLGDGNDVLDVAGTFDIGGGTFALGAGDDTFVVHDNTTITGTIDGGDGLDTRVYDINANADLGALVNFEGLTKTGTGVLSIQGPGSSGLAEVEVLGGTLNIASTGGIVGVTTAVVAAGATLNVDGEFDFTAGSDTFAVGGTITGATAIDMLDGDDRLTLSDGADLSGLAAPLDGGSGDDTLIADIATSATLGGVTGFENLMKEGTGVLNVAANSTFDTVLADAGLLDVASGATLGANIARVSAGATLNVNGNVRFTAGGDTFTIAGNVTGTGTIDMLDGDDQLTLRDGADLSGLATSLDGGDGNDTLTADIATQATLGGATAFETLIKEGTGLVTIAGPADSMFDTVLVRDGELSVAAGALVDPTTTAIDAAATMTIDGTYHGTGDADTFTLSGTLAGSGTVDLLDGDDVVTVNTGAEVAFTGVFDAGAASADRFVLAGTGTDIFDAGLIGTVFRNFDAFRKEGAGTWRLSGTGNHDWTVAEGTLIGDTRSFGGNIANAATVVFDQASDGTYGHVLSGTGTLIKQNTGTLVMSGTNTFTGNTQIEAGTLQVTGTLPGVLTIASGATLSGTGTVGSVTNLGGAFVAPGTAALPFGTLTISGNYAGGGTVRINTVLGNEASDTGRLVIQGNASGSSTVLVNRWSGDGARTQGDGIEIIQVDGASPAGSFQLGQSVEAGAYEYLLYQGGTADANDWYLRSELIDPSNPPGEEEPPTPAFRAGVPGYVLGHQANLEYGFTALGNLRARVGNQGRVAGARHSSDAWLRVYADEIDVSGKRFAAQDQQMTNLQFGTDLYTHASGEASTHVGVMASIGESRATMFDSARAVAGLSTLAGEMQTDAKGIGMYWTHFGASGGYFDLAAQALHYTNRYDDQTLTDADQTGWGGTLSAELGAVYALGANWMIEPQLQLAYQRLELDAFDDQVSRIDAVDDDGLRARAGVQLLRAPSDWLGMHHASPYIGIGAQRDLRGASAVTIGGTRLNDEIPDTTGDINFGFTGGVLSGVELHLDVRYQKSTEGEKDGVRANFGFRMSF